MRNIKNKQQKARFAFVGVLNTLIDLGTYTVLNISGLNPIVANYISTTAALLFSYFANGKFTFQDDEIFTLKKAVPFFAVTLTGLWVIQPLIIILMMPVIKAIIDHGLVVSILAKIAAAIVTLSWNYIMYKRFVYKSS